MTLLDGIVFSPTATGHSVNYRSVVVMGKAELIEGHDAKLAAMRDFVEYVIRGRWNTVRPPSEQELKGTMVLAVPLVEASAKVRTGFAVDERRYASGAWTGVLPFKWTPGEPLRDPPAIKPFRSRRIYKNIRALNESAAISLFFSSARTSWI